MTLYSAVLFEFVFTVIKNYVQTEIQIEHPIVTNTKPAHLLQYFIESGTSIAFMVPVLPCYFPTFSSTSYLSFTWSRAGGHPLCLRCLTMEIWRPKLRWTEQHSSQIRTPRLILVQPGSSMQTEISGLTSTLDIQCYLLQTSVKVKSHLFLLSLCSFSISCEGNESKSGVCKLLLELYMMLNIISAQNIAIQNKTIIQYVLKSQSNP